MAVVFVPQQRQEQLLLVRDDVADPVRARAGGEPLQVTINVTRVVATSGPAAAVWRACRTVARSPWMPWHPFAVIYRGFKDGYVEAARYPGLLRTIVWIAVATGVAATLWRHWTTPISVLGGLLAFLVIIARTGQLREVVDALQAAGGFSPILTVLEHTWITVARKARR
jgi:hypothetical protein